MEKDKVKIEKRLENMKEFYIKTNEIVDNLPDSIPEKIKTTLKNAITGDKELKKLMEGIDSHRPPRMLLIGRTGVGKSSFINAICEAYVAPVSNVKSCTKHTTKYEYKGEADQPLMEFLDTRGIAESESLNDTVSAEEMLLSEINEFSPDVVIMMLNCTRRDDIVDDVEFLKKVTREYEEFHKIKLPIVVVVNKCDEMAPSRYKEPKNYPQNKTEKIQEVVRYYKGIIAKNGLEINDIVPVSSLIDWQTYDGTEVDVEQIAELRKLDIMNLKIAFDGRYGIDELIDILEDAIVDFEAKMGLKMAARLNVVINRVAKHLNKIFSGISATVALTPIPLSDIYILLILQSMLVALIASLSGREVSLDTGKEFIFSIGGVGAIGFGARLLAGQLGKLANVVFPGAGTAISSTVAYAGTNIIGSAAITYYINDQNMDVVKEKFEESKNKMKEKKNI